MRGGIYGLFRDRRVDNYLAENMALLREGVSSEDEDRILNTDEHEYVSEVVKRFSIEGVQLEFDRMSTTVETRHVRAEDFPPNFFVEPGERYPKDTFVFHIPFTGNGSVLSCRPNTFSSFTPNAVVSDKEITFEVVDFGYTEEQLKQIVEETTDAIRRQHANLSQDISRYNEGLENPVRAILRRRKEEAGRRNELLAALGIAKRGDDASSSQEETLTPSGEEAGPEAAQSKVSIAPDGRPLEEWAGASRATLAVVFTDVVGSTKLRREVGDEAMDRMVAEHFEAGRRHVAEYGGQVIKTIGDSLLVVLRTACDALDFALAFREATGDDRINIRVGIHVGPVQIKGGDVSGSIVDYAERVTGAVEGPEVCLSERARSDIDLERANRHAHLQWVQHSEENLKGFESGQVLWSIDE